MMTIITVIIIIIVVVVIVIIIRQARRLTFHGHSGARAYIQNPSLLLVYAHTHLHVFVLLYAYIITSRLSYIRQIYINQ